MEVASHAQKEAHFFNISGCGILEMTSSLEGAGLMPGLTFTMPRNSRLAVPKIRIANEHSLVALLRQTSYKNV